MQARYYDPVIGRFLSIDPVGFLETGDPGMFGRYTYSLNDPVNRIDPDGKQSCQDCRVREIQVKKVQPVEGKIATKTNTSSSRYSDGRYEPTGTKGYRGGRAHRGIDIVAQTGTDVKTPEGGTVEVAKGGFRSAGKMVVIDNGKGQQLKFQHLDSIAVSSEEGSNTVSAGETIGTVGTTGNAYSNGPHLHFEVRTGFKENVSAGTSQDPNAYLNDPIKTYVDGPDVK